MNAASRPLRVVIFAESYLPYLSGVTISTDALARGLRAAGHQVLVVAPRPARALPPSDAWVDAVEGGTDAGGSEAETGPLGPAWLPSYQLPRLVPRGYRMPWPWPRSRALREARRFAPDVIHAQSPFVSGLMARALARRTGAPLVFTHHTRFSEYRHYLGPLARPGAAATDAYLRRFWRSCAAIVTPSAALAVEIGASLDPTTRPLVRVIPTGLELAAIARLEPRDPRAAAGWPEDAVVVAALGRLAPEKSVDELFSAFAAAEPRERLRLLVIGGGPSEVALRRRAAARDLAGRVHFAGTLPRLEALSLLRGADLFAFASRTETQGLVLAEALACRLPVVAVAGPGVADSVRHGRDGLIVAADTAGGRVAGLGAAIGALAADAGRRKAMARAARAGARRFDLSVRIGEIVELYRQLLAA